jgi:hypothetical protein
MPALRRSNKSTRFTRINEVAKQLGVERTHLWRVVTGRRPSRRLLARVKRLGLNWDIVH